MTEKLKHPETDRLTRLLRTGLTINETAQELGVSTRTVFRLIKIGELESEITYYPTAHHVICPISIARVQLRAEFEQKLKEKELELREKFKNRYKRKPKGGTHNGN